MAVPAVSGTASTSITCPRTIRDLKTDMKEIALVANWTGYDGLGHTLRLITRREKSGLYDYF